MSKDQQNTTFSKSAVSVISALTACFALNCAGKWSDIIARHFKIAACAKCQNLTAFQLLCVFCNCRRWDQSEVCGAGTSVCTYSTYARTLNRTISQQYRRCEMLETTALTVRISPTATGGPRRGQTGFRAAHAGTAGRAGREVLSRRRPHIVVAHKQEVIELIDRCRNVPCQDRELP